LNSVIIFSIGTTLASTTTPHLKIHQLTILQNWERNKFGSWIYVFRLEISPPWKAIIIFRSSWPASQIYQQCVLNSKEKFVWYNHVLFKKETAITVLSQTLSYLTVHRVPLLLYLLFHTPHDFWRNHAALLFFSTRYVAHCLVSFMQSCQDKI
jgi:hypothetical protein